MTDATMIDREIEGSVGKVLTEQYSFAVAPSMKKAIRRAARREKVSVSVWVRRACYDRLTAGTDDDG